MDRYLQTIPYFICQQTYRECIADHPNDLQGQSNCEAAFNKFCNNYVNASAADAQVTVTSVANVVVTTIPGISRTTEQVTLEIIEPSSVSLQSSAATTSSSSSSSSTPTQTTSPARSGSSISKGALGVAIALPILFVIALAAFIFWLWRRHRRQKAERDNATDEKPTWERRELAADDETEIPRKELPQDNTRYELPAGREIGREELDGRKTDVNRRAEMSVNEPVGAEVRAEGRRELEGSGIRSSSGVPSDTPLLATQQPGAGGSAERTIKRKEIPKRSP